MDDDEDRGTWWDLPPGFRWLFWVVGAGIPGLPLVFWMRYAGAKPRLQDAVVVLAPVLPVLLLYGLAVFSLRASGRCSVCGKTYRLRDFACNGGTCGDCKAGFFTVPYWMKALVGRGRR